MIMFVTKVHVFNLGKFRIDREPTRRIKRIFYLCETLYIPNILFKRCDLSINNIHNEGVHRFLSKYLLKFNLWLKFPNGFRLILFCVTTPWKLVFEFELIKFNFSADCECKVNAHPFNFQNTFQKTYTHAFICAEKSIEITFLFISDMICTFSYYAHVTIQ